jgi:hypothetical protein
MVGAPLTHEDAGRGSVARLDELVGMEQPARNRPEKLSGTQVAAERCVADDGSRAGGPGSSRIEVSRVARQRVRNVLRCWLADLGEALAPGEMNRASTPRQAPMKRWCISPIPPHHVVSSSPGCR